MVIGSEKDFEQKLSARVVAAKNTSIVIPASRKRRWKGNPVVSDETVMYGYQSSASLTTDRLYYKLQTRPLVRESIDQVVFACVSCEVRTVLSSERATYKNKAATFRKQPSDRKKYLVTSPRAGSTPRHPD
jgi:hypothetical protein